MNSRRRAEAEAPPPKITVTCNNCGGARVTVPLIWHGTQTPRPQRCKSCNGKGELEID